MDAPEKAKTEGRACFAPPPVRWSIRERSVTQRPRKVVKVVLRLVFLMNGGNGIGNEVYVNDVILSVGRNGSAGSPARKTNALTMSNCVVSG